MSKKRDQPSMVCCFCGSSENNESEFGKFYEHDGITTHYYCLLLSSNMEQRGNDDEGILGFLTDDIKKEIRRGKRLICVHCRKSGATLGCCNIRCKQIFHYPCGKRAGSLNQFFGEFRSFCKKHSPRQKIDDYVKKELEKSNNILCCICYDEINPHDFVQTLWAPCCKKNAWFHRKCVQQLANSAGYFFKCPLCNNKKKFQKAMQEFGIFIPSQDASWELVPNAFQELMYRHDQCDAPVCLCPKGRKYTSSNAKWELALCRTCGSQGIHMACGQLKWAKPNWECAECTSILSKHVQLNNSMNLNLGKENFDSDDSDSDISVGMELPVICPSSIPDDCSISSYSSDTTQSETMGGTSSSSKSTEDNAVCIDEEDIHIIRNTNCRHSRSTENLHCSDQKSCSSQNSTFCLLSLTDNEDKDGVTTVGSIENPELPKTAPSSPGVAFITETVEEDEIQYIGVLKTDNSSHWNSNSVEPSSMTGNLISEHDGKSECTETLSNMKIVHLTSLSPEYFNTITEAGDAQTISELTPSHIPITHKSIRSKAASLSPVYKENIVVKVKRKSDSVYSTDKTTKKIKGDDCSEVVTEKGSPLKETSNQISSTEVQDANTANLQKEHKSDNCCILYDNGRHKISSTTSATLNARASRKEHAQSPPLECISKTIEGTVFNSDPLSSETLTNGDVIYEKILPNRKCKSSQSDGAMHFEDDEGNEELYCEILTKSVDTLNNKNRNQDASCDRQRCAGTAEYTKPREERLKENSKYKEGMCFARTNTNRQPSFELSPETREFTLEEVIHELTDSYSAYNRPRLIPKYVNLCNLKFRLDGADGLQMTLFNEYSVKMDIDTAKKTNVKLDPFLQNLHRSEFCKIQRDTTHSEVFVNNVSNPSPVGKRDKCKNGELVNGYTEPPNDDTKENLDPVSTSCKKVPNLITSENNVVSKLPSNDVNASVNLHVSTNAIDDENPITTRDKQNSQPNSVAGTVIFLHNDIATERCNKDKSLTTDRIHTDTNFVFRKKAAQRTPQQRIIDHTNKNLKNSLSSSRNAYSLKEPSLLLTNVTSSIPNLRNRKSGLAIEQNVTRTEDVECVSSSTTEQRRMDKRTENNDKNISEKYKKVSKNTMAPTNSKRSNKIQTCLKVSIDLNKIQNLIDVNPDMLKNRSRTRYKYSEKCGPAKNLNESNRIKHTDSVTVRRDDNNSKLHSLRNEITQSVVDCVNDSQRKVQDTEKFSNDSDEDCASLTNSVSSNSKYYLKRTKYFEEPCILNR